MLGTCRILNIFYGRFSPENLDIVNILLTFATETKRDTASPPALHILRCHQHRTSPRREGAGRRKQIRFSFASNSLQIRKHRPSKSPLKGDLQDSTADYQSNQGG